MPRCIIENCTSVYDNIKERRQLFFNAPKDPCILKLWQKIINRQNFVVKPHHVVCEKHFRKEDIMWRREIKDQNGVVIGVSPYKLPRLKKGVLPSLYVENHSKCDDFNLPTRESETCPNLEKFNLKENDRPNSHDSIEDVTITVQPDLTYSNFAYESSKTPLEIKEESESKASCDTLSRTELTFEDILSNNTLEVPSSWIKYSISNENESVLVLNENICRLTGNGLKTVVLKEIIIDEQLCVHINVLNERVNNNYLQFQKINSICHLQDIVNLVHKLNICKGYCTSKNIDYSAVYVDPLNTYRHVKCLLLVMNESRCKFCYK